MKMKERPLDWWKGKKFTQWCRADKNDERKINYIFRVGKETQRFTSDDTVSWGTIEKMRECRINSVDLRDGQWYVDIAI